MPTIGKQLMVALHHHWNIQQLDISNNFLHDILDNNIYVIQLLGFIDAHYLHHVCFLMKAIYSLNQAP